MLGRGLQGVVVRWMMRGGGGREREGGWRRGGGGIRWLWMLGRWWIGRGSGGWEAGGLGHVWGIEMGLKNVPGDWGEM